MRDFIIKNRDYLLFLFGFILGALFMIFDISCLNAEEVTYYDWEQVEVNELPTASSSTMNKVYINNSKYYITNEVVTVAGNSRPLQVGDDLCNGYVIIEDFTTQELIDWYESYHGDVYNPKIMYNDVSYAYSFSFINGSHTFTFYGFNLMYNDIKKSSISFPYTMDFSNHQVCTSDYVPDTVQYIHPDWNLTFIKYISNSSTTTYSWQEVSEDLVIPVKQNKIYVPTDNLKCYRFIDRDTLRGYFTKPEINDSVTYYDFYLDKHYNSVEGTETITEEVTCIENTTSDYLYRNDIVEILIFFVIVAIIVIYIPVKVLFRLFRRFN